MVNGLRHYPVAKPVAQTFPHPYLNETGVPAALTQGAAVSLRAGGQTAVCVKRRLEDAAPCFIASPLLLAENYPRFRQIVR